MSKQVVPYPSKSDLEMAVAALVRRSYLVVARAITSLESTIYLEGLLEYLRTKKMTRANPRG